MWFPNLATHLPKVVLAGGSMDSPKPQNVAVPLEKVSLRSLKAAQGLRMSANISISIQKVPQLPGHSFV